MYAYSTYTVINFIICTVHTQYMHCRHTAHTLYQRGVLVPYTHLWLSTQSKVDELYIPITVQQEILLGGGYMSTTCTYIHIVPHALVCTHSTHSTTAHTVHSTHSIQYCVQYISVHFELQIIFIHHHLIKPTL